MNRNKVIAAAQKFVQKGQLDKAIREYRKVVDEDPRDVRIWLKIGDLQARRGASSEAVETYSKVAEYYSEQGFYLKAVAVYKQILRLDPELVDVNLRLAELYKQLGLLNDAMRQYEQVSNHLHQQGRSREALDALRQIINLDPANVASRIKLAELYSTQGMKDQAVEEFAKAADYLRASNRLDDFVKVAERLIYHQADNLPVLRELARVYLRRKDAARALQKLQMAFKLDPRDIDTLEMLADAFHALKQRQKTISVLKELARLYEEVGERTKQRDVFQRVLQISPDDEDARRALRRFQAMSSGASDSNPIGVPATRQRVTSSGSMPPPPPPPRKAPRGVSGHPAQKPGQRATGHASPPPTPQTREAAPSPSQTTSPPVRQQPSPTEQSVSQASSPAVTKIIAEAEVYIKYGLQDKAVEHLSQVFAHDPDNADVRLKLRDLYIQMGQFPLAAKELVSLAQHLVNVDRRQAADLLNEALELHPESGQAHALLAAVEGSNVHDAVHFEQDDDNLEEDTLERVGEDPSGQIPEAYPVYDQLEEGGQKEQVWEIPEDDIDSIDSSGDLDFVPEYAEEAAEEPQEIVVDTGLEFPAVEMGTSKDLGMPDASVEDMNPGLEEDLEEAEFFIQQSLYSEARAILLDLLRRFPEHPLIEAKLAEMELAEEENRSHTSIPAPSFESASELDLGIGDFALPTLEPEESETTSPRIIKTGSYSVEDVVSNFQPEDGSMAGDEDTDTHYDLGIAYREMGLIDDAIKEFEVAMRAKDKRALCHMMIGLIHMDRNEFTEAVKQFSNGLLVEDLRDQEAINIRYELGAAHEAAAQPRRALDSYLQVARLSPRFRDVASRVKDLRAQLDAAVEGTG